jgi:hypothetical protein
MTAGAQESSLPISAYGRGLGEQVGLRHLLVPGVAAVMRDPALCPAAI